MKVGFTETILRDANQSLMATRLSFDEFKDILPVLNKTGYYSLECWGGATFDSCLRYLNEDPWERLRKIKKACPDTKLQMLLRGQNLLGYRHYPDDIVRRFIRKSVENGIDIIRIFDALNDIENIKVAVDETLKSGAMASGAICYTISPIHNIESYVKLACEMEKIGVSTISIKDMAGIMSPAKTYELVKAIKKEVKVPVAVHTHSTTGLGILTLQRAAEAGADIIDTAISCFSGGTSQPSTQTLNFSIAEEGIETGLDEDCLEQTENFFRKIWNKAIEDGRLKPSVTLTDINALAYQIPGGMISNLMSQLDSQGKLDMFPQVLKETPRVRKDLGYPPLVTPMSQMVGAQATTNVLTGKRYQTVSKEVKSYLLGEYGKAPGKINEKVRKQVLGDEKPFTGRYADTLGEGFPKAQTEIGALAKSEEDVLSYALFPIQAENYFMKRAENEKKTVQYSIQRID